MYIGSLKSHVKAVKLLRRGTLLEAVPDVVGAEGCLFDGGSVTFAQLTVLNTGIDLDITLDGAVFVDTVILSGCAGVASSEVYLPHGSSLQPVARASAGENPVVGVNADRLIVRLNTNYTSLTVAGLDIAGAVFDGLQLWPQPKNVTYEDGAPFVLKEADAILCDEDDADSLFAAKYFAEQVKKRAGAELEIRPLGSMFRKAVIFRKDLSVAKEASRIRSMPRILSVMASDRLGLVYAAATLLSAIEDGAIRPFTVNDAPYKEFRGAHFGLPKRENIPFFKNIISELLVPMKYNTLFIEVAGGMEFRSHPEINETWNAYTDAFEEGRIPAKIPHADMVCGGRCLTQDEVRDIVDYAKEWGLEVIPEIQSLSHVQYITAAHPEIGEVPVEDKEKQDKSEAFSVADIRPDKKIPHCFCALCDEAYDILFDIGEEILDVFRPKRYVHMGHDEVYEIGVCERCHDHDPAELFARDVNRIHDWLAKKGLKMMIWGDMLHDCTRYLTPPAIDMIPKDIVLLDFIWYFHFDKDIEPHLLEHGFKVMMGNLYSSHYPRYAARIAQDGMIGGQISMWVDTEEYRLAYEGKMYDMLYTADLLWHEGYNENCRRAYDLVLRPLIRQLRQNLRGESEDYAKSESLLGSSSVPLTVASPAAAFAEAISATVRVDNTADALLFTHAADRAAARIAWKALLPVAKYVVTYEDGATVTVPVEYGGNIRSMHERHAEPLKPPYYRHEGYIATYLADPVSEKDDEGSDVTFYRYLWKNPAPDKKIATVTLAGDGETDVRVMLYGLERLER